MSQRTEQEIMRNWKYMDPPLVSVCCITYNHEPYIRDAIEGFLMQETDFPFEVIIHDDASTDKTAEIVREYAEQYPQIIKPIFQTENQYSKGVGVSATYVWPRVQGEYIALCEGDDYWTDSKKLQIQIAEMEKHRECDISFHPATVQYMDKSRPDTVQGQQRQETCVIPLSEVIRGGGGFCPTASIIIRKKVLDNMPKWFSKDAPVGDLFIQIYGAKKNGALFVNRIMSVYRSAVPQSWSYRNKMYFDGFYNCKKRLILFLTLAKTDFEIVYSCEFERLIAESQYELAVVSLRNHAFFLFKESIESSYRILPKLNVRQFLLFKISIFPKFALLLYSCYRFIKNGFL